MPASIDLAQRMLNLNYGKAVQRSTPPLIQHSELLLLKGLSMSLRSLRLALGSVAAAASCLAVAVPSHAGGDAEVARLLQTGHSMKWNAVPQGKQLSYGHAEALVNASPERLMQIVTAYGQYKDLVPEKFKASRIIAKDATGTDLYVQIPMKGPLPITLAPILHFGPPTHVSPTTTVVEGKFVRGSYVKDANVVFTIRQVNPEVSLLKLDLLIQPTLPATQGMIDEESRDAALQAVDAIHDKAQGNRATVTAVAINN
jgi:hypothetical protein